MCRIFCKRFGNVHFPDPLFRCLPEHPDPFHHIQLLLPSCSCIFYQFAQGFHLCICCTCYHMKFLFLNDIFYFLELWEYKVRNNSYGIFLPQHLFYYTCYAQKKQFTPFRANCFFLFLFTVQPCYSQADLRLTGSFLR